MASRKITLLLVAATVALGTVFAVRSLMGPQQPQTAAQAQAPAVPTVEVAAAAHDLRAGQLLKEADFKWVPWASTGDTSALFVKGKANLTDLTGSVARDAIASGEPIVSSRVVQPKDQGFLAAVLTPGLRAMSVSLSPTAQVAGFIFPGDRVDVILTHGFSRKDSTDLTERRVSETILQNVRVLALDQRSEKGSDPKVAQLATLELSDKQAEKLALAADMAAQTASKGTLMLVLRSLATEEKDEQAKKSAPTWDSDVSPAYPSMNGEDSLMHRVQVMRGKATTESTFERHD